MRNLKLVLFFVLTISLFCSITNYRAEGQSTSTQVERDNAPPTINVPSLVKDNTEFAFNLYHELAREKQGNLIFSPYSISIAFSMLYAGAHGETAAQIATTLDFTLPPEQLYPAFNALDLALQPSQKVVATQPPDFPFATDLTLNISNSIWGQKGFPFEEAYLKTLGLNYGANLNQTDFRANPEAARQEINRWVEEATRGRIKDIPPPDAITSQTRLALLNAIYFKGEWTYPFNRNETYDEKFHLENGEEVSVPMMVDDFTDLECGRGEDYYAIKLTYGASESAAMLILLPDSGRFQDFEDTLDARMFQTALATLKFTNTLKFRMPRFGFRSQIDLQKTFAAMGMTKPFSNQADFTGMSSDDGLSINYAGHSATITVDEQGTEATGVTVAMMAIMAVSGGCGDQMTADRPFIFAIYDRDTNAILFLGRVMNPSV